MARRGVIVAAVAVLAGSIAGTGSATLSPKEYKAELAALGKESDASQAMVEQGLKTATVPKLRTALTRFAGAQDKMASEVAALKPPANAAAANAQLAKGLHDIAAATREVVRTLSGVRTISHATAVLKRNTSGARAGAEVDAAITKLEKLGYTSGS